MNQKWTIMFRPHKIRQLNTFCKEKDIDMPRYLEELGDYKDEVLLYQNAIEEGRLLISALRSNLTCIERNHAV